MAGFVAVESVQSYPISGDTPDALTQQMALHGPRHSASQRAWARTGWDLQIHYVLEQSGSQCQLREPGVTLQLRMTLPELQQPARLSPAMRLRWSKAHERMVEHEQIHRAHAHVAARGVLEQLQRLHGQPRCAALERAAQGVLRSATRDARRKSMAFDRATDFGARAGIVPEDVRPVAPNDAGLVY